MKANETTKANLESVLLEFRVEAGEPRPGVLEAYCRRYPQFARELTDYAVEWLLDEAMAAEEASGEAASASSSPIVSRAISHLYNGMREREAAKRMAARTSNASGRNPFQGLELPRKRAICGELGIDMTIFAKLQNRLIDVASIPEKFIGRIAQTLGASVDDIVGHLQLPAIVNAGADFKAESKPSAELPKQRFEEAVGASSLDEKQKRALLEG